MDSINQISDRNNTDEELSFDDAKMVEVEEDLTQ